jgi:hypothetical protein
VLVYAGVDPLTGKDHYLTESTRDEAEAQKILTRLLNAVDEQRNPRTKATLGAAPAVAQPAEHQLTAQVVVSDLLRCELLGVEKNGQSVVAAVPSRVGPGRLDCVPHAPFGREGRRVDPWGQVDGDLYVAELYGSGHAVDRDVGRAECGPHLVRISAEAVCRLLCSPEEGRRQSPIVGP